MRQVDAVHRPLLAAIEVDSIYVPTDLIAREVLARIVYPEFWTFIEEAVQCDDAWAESTRDRLLERMGREVPEHKLITLDAHEAPAVVRWLADRGRLYWIAWGRDGVRLRVTSDGDTWNAIDLPDGVGSPTDVRRFRDGIVVLTTRALVRVDGETPVVLGSVPLAGGAKEKATPSPFALDDIFCSAPLGVVGGELYAGGQRDGALYRWDPK